MNFIRSIGVTIYYTYGDRFCQIFEDFFTLKILITCIYSKYFIYFLSMNDFNSEIKRLQKLSCIALSAEEEQKLWKQLADIIQFLGELPDTKIKDEELRVKDEGKLTLRTIAGVKEDPDGKNILKNVKHEIINNSIVIKSVLS